MRAPHVGAGAQPPRRGPAEGSGGLPLSRPHLHTVEDAARWAFETFQRKWEEKPELREKLKGKDRVILFDLTDAEPWTIYVQDGRFTHYVKGGHRHPDARLKASTKDLLAVFNREVPVLQAYLSGRVKVEASLRDVLFLKNLIADVVRR